MQMLEQQGRLPRPLIIGWVQRCMWEEWYASDVMRCRAHPAHYWHGTTLWLTLFPAPGSDAEQAVSSVFSPKEWAILEFRCAQFGSLCVGALVGCPLMWLSKQVAAMAPAFLASFLLMNVLHDKTFPCTAEWEGKGRGKRCLESCRDGWGSALHALGYDFTSCSAVNCMQKCHIRALGFEWCKEQNGERGWVLKCCLRPVENQRAEALIWESYFIHSTGYNEPS